MKKILGLDLGTNSIGWAVVNEAESADEQSSIVKLGVRVNPLTVDEQTNFEKGKPKKMTAVQNPDFYLDDEQRINEQDKTLKGFLLLEEHRPKSPEDIYIHRD